MSRITLTELEMVEGLLRLEHSLYEKFCLYAEIAGEEATQKLCKQLADRSREHFEALTGCLELEAGQGVH